MNFDDLMRLAPLWERLADERRPILLYGTGNGADKILDIMARRSIACAGVFASDGFVRARDFRSMRVTSYSDALARYGEDAVILVAFGSPREEVLSFVDALSARHTVFVPDAPLFSDDAEGEIFTREYALAHRDEIERAAALFADDGSRELYWETLAYRLTGEAKYLSRTEPFAASVASCLPRDVTRVIDGGAFTGDTARVFLDAFPRLRRIVCAEPDARTFRRLADFSASDGRVTALNVSLGATVGTDVFSSSASRASATEAQNRRQKTVEVRRVTVDMLTGRGGSADEPEFGAAAGDGLPHAADEYAASLRSGNGQGRLLLKLDVEGAERAALEGARLTLDAERPALAVALYHRTADIFALPLMLAQYYPDGGFRLRRARCLPCWELTMFAT